MKRKTHILLAVILFVVIAAGACAFLLPEKPTTPIYYGTVTGHNNERVFVLEIENAENAELDVRKAYVVWENASEFKVGDRVRVVTDGSQPGGPYSPEPEDRHTAYYALSVKKLWWPC